MIIAWRFKIIFTSRVGILSKSYVRVYYGSLPMGCWRVMTEWERVRRRSPANELGKQASEKEVAGEQENKSVWTLGPSSSPHDNMIWWYGVGSAAEA